MIVCATCHHDNTPWRKHCGGCGGRLPGACAACGTVNGPADRFCGECGRAVRRTRAPQPQETTMPIEVIDAIP